MNTNFTVHDPIKQYLLDKAGKEVQRLISHEKWPRKWKKLCNQNGVIRCKLNCCYRLVVSIEDIHTGPYHIMS